MAITAELKMARQKTCQDCEHLIKRGGHIWKWWHCMAQGWDNLIERTDEFMCGAETNCPAGKWIGLKPVKDLPPPPNFETQAARFIRNFDPLLKRLSTQELAQALLEMVAAGYMPAEMAQAIAEKKGIPLDAPI